ncbi:GMC oxidoreductase-domain-containing protein [Amanita rubescens]|nr:GMC oxidoreductase-domain-containing protein [Amanita rubescens]KAF8338418.1 GMC oxidoreductase-domain-containing protein [Amanita rubescens]
MTSAAQPEYDIIFAGGGATACIVAGRLAAADSTLKILIIEDGPGKRDKPVHVQPARYFGNLVDPNSKTFLHHQGRPSEALGGRSPVVSAGRCLGGGSGVNFMVYTRAAASDYDDWETVHKNPGWGSKELIPLLQKAETFDRNAPYHGYNGPIKVSYREDELNVADDFLDVVGKYDKKRQFTDDVNGYVDPVTGRRSDTAHHYIYNQIDKNQNLVVLHGKKVVRVLFEDLKATGVGYIDESTSQRNTAKASRLVVLSAGTFGSPTILQRSGIGNADLLKKYDIEPLVDLPGVGENYMDHNVLFPAYIASDDAETVDIIFRGGGEMTQPFVQQWLETGKGLIAHNGIDAGIKLRPGPEELEELGQVFENEWKNYYAPAPDKPLIIVLIAGGMANASSEPPTKKYLTVAYFNGYPASTGFVKIAAGNDPYSPVDFHPGYLDVPSDMAVLRWGYKRSREIIRRMKTYRGEYNLEHPKFPKGSLAECRPTDGPVDINEPDIAYSKEDDEAIDQFHREKVSTSWHSIGTCAMKRREAGGVVDSRLNVYGNCSIAPGNVGANTYNTAIAIGEKAAVLIAEDLGIIGV